MLYLEINKKRNKIIISHFVILGLMTILFVVSLVMRQDNYLLISGIFAFIAFLIIISLIRLRMKLKKVLLGMDVMVVSVDDKVPYPEKFKVNSSGLSEIFKSYRYKNIQIPSYFAEFKEGRTVYLYKHIDKSVAKQAMKIVGVHSFKYILVEGEDKKKKIAHLNSLKSLE